METIRLIETKSGKFKIQQEMVFKKIEWADRSDSYEYEIALKKYEEFKLNGVPDFFGEDYYKTPEKNILFKDEVNEKDEY